MSYVVVTTFPGITVDAFEKLLGKNEATLKRLEAVAREAGALRHMFVADSDDNVLVVDEWSSVEDFERFFGGQDDIKMMLEDAGITGPPTTVAYRVLDAPDRF